MKPKARTEGLVVEEMGSELVIYDRETSTSHTLNETAARLFRACDGEKTVEQLEGLFSEVADADGRRQLVSSSLRQLERANLLSASVASVVEVSRRDVLLRVAAAAALPVVLSVTAPAKAQVASTPMTPRNGIDPQIIQLDPDNSDDIVGTTLQDPQPIP